MQSAWIDRPRIVIYDFARPLPFLIGDAEASLRADMLAMCAKDDPSRVETVVGLRSTARSSDGHLLTLRSFGQSGARQTA